jgi:hypothetical protein
VGYATGGAAVLLAPVAPDVHGLAALATAGEGVADPDTLEPGPLGLPLDRLAPTEQPAPVARPVVAEAGGVGRERREERPRGVTIGGLLGNARR